MKFKDLEFKPHPVSKNMLDKPIFEEWENHTQAFWEENGVKVSVIFGKMFYSNGIDTYEAMVTKGGLDEGEEPVGYLTKNEVEGFINKACNDND